jgi:hypothetical protein
VVVDTWETHRAASLVQGVAAVAGVTGDRGEKGQCGSVATRQSRAAFVSEPSPRVVLHSTPTPCSWLNQSDSWRSILGRKLLKRGAFTAVEELKAKVLACLESYNRTRARPFKWTSQGKPLMA